MSCKNECCAISMQLLPTGVNLRVENIHPIAVPRKRGWGGGDTAHRSSTRSDLQICISFQFDEKMLERGDVKFLLRFHCDVILEFETNLK